MSQMQDILRGPHLRELVTAPIGVPLVIVHPLRFIPLNEPQMHHRPGGDNRERDELEHGGAH